MPTTIDDALELPCGAIISNRIAKAAMTEGIAGEDGNPTSRHATLYARWSEGGAGLLITGNTMVDRQFLERPGNVVVDDQTDRDALHHWAREGTRRANQLWMQLNHPGRQCSIDVTDEPVAPSAVPLKTSNMFATPRRLDDAEIETIIDAFARAAAIARDTGFTGVQIHAAHGYLLNQFLSPRTNRRSDRWGGSLANRSRALLEVVDATRRAVGDDFAVAVKLNASDFQDDGFTVDDAGRVAGWLADHGVDLIEVSGGNYEQTAFVGNLPDRPHSDEPGDEPYFLRYARSLRERPGEVPLMLTGGFRSRQSMASGLASGDLDLIGAARPFCADPDLGRKLLAGEITDLPRPARRLRRARSADAVGEGEKKAVADWFYDQIERMARGMEPEPIC